MIGNKVQILVIYDIIDTKRRNSLIRLLNSYGVRVQKSAFEIIISKNGIKRLISDIQRLIDLKSDNIRFYEVLENKYRIKLGVQTDDTLELDEVYVL